MGIAISPELTAQMCREVFAYEPKSGLLTWRKAKGNRRTEGAIAGVLSGSGYRHVEFNGKYYMAHHIVWAIVHGRWPEMPLDHADGNRINNRIENLREVTAAQNAQNRGKSSTNKCGLKGVSWHKASNKWRADIMAHGVNRALGLFATREDAGKAYDEAAKRLHGEFAVTNEIIFAAEHRPVPRATNGENLKMYDPCATGRRRTW